MEDDLNIVATTDWIFLKFQTNAQMGKAKIKNCVKWRQSLMEDYHKILKDKYLRNLWSDLPQILDLLLKC